MSGGGGKSAGAAHAPPLLMKERGRRSRDEPRPSEPLGATAGLESVADRAAGRARIEAAVGRANRPAGAADPDGASVEQPTEASQPSVEGTRYAAGKDGAQAGGARQRYG